MPRRKEILNLLDLKPGRNADWESGEGETVVLLVPRFRAPLLRKWVLPLLRNPSIRIRLDEAGSFIWVRCDGKTPVSVIAGQLSERFGSRVEPLYERIGLFVRRLQRDELIVLH